MFENLTDKKHQHRKSKVTNRRLHFYPFVLVLFWKVCIVA